MILRGDCLERLKELEADSVDSLVTDPPYGLSFMGKRWDYDVPSVEVWREVLRVLKPGAHGLIACGTRTQHRMVVNIEDAGFEIRDVVTWLYGQGFPKSLDVSKAIDKAAGAEREVLGRLPSSRAKPCESGFMMAEKLATAPATDAAKQWQGFGTALKPAVEFWTLVRKPLSEKTVAKNVLKWGTGGINVDGCRIETQEKLSGSGKNPLSHGGQNHRPYHDDPEKGGYTPNQQGRFPANLILSCACQDVEHKEGCAVRGLDEQSGMLKNGGQNYSTKGKSVFGTEKELSITKYAGDSGGASRFFYCAKVSPSERNAGLDGGGARARDFEGDTGRSSYASQLKPDDWKRVSANHHPTVKPLKLMRYLCRLVTPPNGLVLDPFAGSGSTGVAALQEGFRFLGVERESEYAEIAEKRMEAVS